MTSIRLVLLPAVAIAMTLPLAAQANSVGTPLPAETGITTTLIISRVPRRAQVAEVEAAQGRLACLCCGAGAAADESVEPPKTRQQVIDEMRRVPDARRARLN